MSFKKRLVDARELKTLVVDIERRQGLARFFDLKTRYISPDNVERWPSTVCLAWQWLGERRVQFAAEWQGDDLAEVARSLLDEADLVVTYNGVGFDEKHMKSDIVMAGLTPPSPYKSIDLYRAVRSQFGFESKRLGVVLDRLQMPSKNDKYNPAHVEAAIAGDEKAQRRFKRYNVGDVKVTGALYWRLLPWLKTHPHVAPSAGLDSNLCPRCASDRVQRAGTWSPGVYHYAAYRCLDCGGYYRTTLEARGPSVRTL